MSSQFESFAGIFRLALEGKKDEAIDAVIAERARLTALKAELTDQLARADEDLAMLNTMLPQGMAPSPAASSRNRLNKTLADFALSAERRLQSVADKGKRDSAIIETAKELGRIKNKFDTTSIAAELARKGVQMGVPENRASTVISRLLLRNENVFEKVTTGVYKLRNA